MKNRIIYLIIIILTTLLGLASRRFSNPQSWIFLYAGDALWATLFYFNFRFLFLKKKQSRVAAIALTWCFAIEFSQLNQSLWINELRTTLFGKLILGSGFLWSDLISYTLGIGLAYILDTSIIKKHPSVKNNNSC